MSEEALTAEKVFILFEDAFAEIQKEYRRDVAGFAHHVEELRARVGALEGGGPTLPRPSKAYVEAVLKRVARDGEFEEADVEVLAGFDPAWVGPCSSFKHSGTAACATCGHHESMHYLAPGDPAEPEEGGAESVCECPAPDSWPIAPDCPLHGPLVEGIADRLEALEKRVKEYRKAGIITGDEANRMVGELRKRHAPPGYFWLDRLEDETGISGTGKIAEGVEFSDGKVVMRWLTEHRSTCFYDSMEEVVAIHGHEGKTVVRRAEEEKP